MITVNSANSTHYVTSSSLLTSGAQQTVTMEFSWDDKNNTHADGFVVKNGAGTTLATYYGRFNGQITVKTFTIDASDNDGVIQIYLVDGVAETFQDPGGNDRFFIGYVTVATMLNEKWGTDNIGKGKAYVYLRSYSDMDTFAGFPQPTFQVKGKKDIYDPRDTTYKYTDNPALCLADYITMPIEEGGLGEPWSKIE